MRESANDLYMYKYKYIYIYTQLYIFIYIYVLSMFADILTIPSSRNPSAHK